MIHSGNEVDIGVANDNTTCVVVLVGTTGTVSTARANPHNAAVFAVTFYRVFLPRPLRLFLVLLPALWGMHRGRGLQQRPLPVLPTVAGAIAIAILTARGASNLGYPLIAGGQFVALVMMWPVGYMVATAARSRWRARTTPA
jgi:hypothetical protein